MIHSEEGYCCSHRDISVFYHQQSQLVTYLCFRKVFRDLNVPTMMTPTLNDLLCFYYMCGAEKVSDLINHPVVCLFGTRVGGTCVKVVT
jgi:hypothetical protein